MAADGSKAWMRDQEPPIELSAALREWSPAVTVVPYVLLVFCVVLTLIIKAGAWGSVLIDMGLCGLAAAWMGFMFSLHPGWRKREGVMAVFFTGLVALMVVLVLRDPWFGFFAPAGYFYAFRILRWPWRLLGIAAVAFVAGTGQSYGVAKTSLLAWALYLAIVATNILLLSGVAVLDRRGNIRQVEREQALAEVREANRKLEATLAENAGLHEQLLTQAREAGVLDERQRMAREIHDTLAQGLAGIITQLQAAEQAGQDPARWRRHVEAATTLARDSLAEARRSVDALRPEPLETARLGDALTNVASRWSLLHGIEAQVTTTGTVRPLQPDAELALLRTAQEALANVGKHARASRVGLTLSYMDHEVALDVRDDGCGFDPEQSLRDGVAEPADGGFGLVAMRQRIEGVRGTLQVESEPGGGTAVSACIPAVAAGSRA
jgi:signal transduction histidine kinase